jgi:hypothetical protein
MRIKASTRRAKLLGLDAAATVHINSTSLRADVSMAEVASKWQERLRMVEEQFERDQEREREAIEAEATPVAIEETATGGTDAGVPERRT